MGFAALRLMAFPDWDLLSVLIPVKVFEKSISLQPLIREYSYLDHRYPVGLAFIPRHRTPGSMPGGGARGQNLVHLQKVGFLC